MRNQEIVLNSGKAPIWEALYHLAIEDEGRSLSAPNPRTADSKERRHTRGPVVIDPGQPLQTSGDGHVSSWHEPIG
eukprot:5662601-Ditylum_brightwellii.AAC.1